MNKKTDSLLLNKSIDKLRNFSAIKNINTFNVQNEILFAFNSLAADPSWSFEKASRKETSYASHGYHRFPAKFIPQLARRCIIEYSKQDDIVCDPFMGSGTTLVESLIYRRKAIGVDINPVAVLIAKVKTNPINPENLNREINKILSDISAIIESQRNKTAPLFDIDIEALVPNNDRIKYWFPQEKTRNELGIIFRRITEVEDESIKNFCLCAFSQILKNCSVWLMKSIKPTRNLKKKPADPLQVFKRHINSMIKGNTELFRLMPEHVKQNLLEYLKIEQRDARDLPSNPNSVDLIVTSPPYVTSYEYADLHQLTALWLGYANNVAEFRKGFIGSIYNRKSIHDSIKSNLANEKIAELEKKSKREAEAVENYFFQMQQCFEQMHKVLKQNGKACIVIGDTELKKVSILNAEIFVEIMLNLGFRIHNVIKRQIPSKILPSTRDSRTGRFTSNHKADRIAYAYEYILVMEKI
ncbi:MAG: DNA methyltransferase [Promethearchaeota archaeon]